MYGQLERRYGESITKPIRRILAGAKAFLCERHGPHKPTTAQHFNLGNAAHFYSLSFVYAYAPTAHHRAIGSSAAQKAHRIHRAAFTGRLAWRGLVFPYKWAYYSQRYTMSSNDFTFTGPLPDYYMSSVALESGLPFKWLDLQLKMAVNNLFNEDYLSVLSRPMLGINFEFFVGVTVKVWSRRGGERELMNAILVNIECMGHPYRLRLALVARASRS